METVISYAINQDIFNQSKFGPVNCRHCFLFTQFYNNEK